MSVRARAERPSVGAVLDWGLERLENERTCWAILGAAMALSALLGLWLTRGITFHADDFLYYVGNRGFNRSVLFGPHNGHLILFARLLYALELKVFGPRNYVVFRIVEVVGVALVAGIFFAFSKRRLGARLAMAPSVLLLFLGSAWQDSLDPVGITHVWCIAAGLGALLVLERRRTAGDIAACALLIVSIATFSVGLMFLLGVAVSVALREDRWRRAWIVVIPLALYAIWFLAPKLDTTPFTTGTGLRLSNVLLIPNGIAVSAAAVSAALAGLSYNFSNPASYTIDSAWGYVVAALAAAALVFRLRRAKITNGLVVSLVILGSYWASTALATHLTAEPNENRYIYDGAVLLLLVGVEAMTGLRVPRPVVVAIFAVTLLSLATNIALMRVGGGFLRGLAPSDRAELAAIEIARDHVDPRFIPQGEPQLTFLDGIVGGAGPYLAAVDRNGSFAFTPAELLRQAEPVRELADSTLGSALRISLVPVPRLRPESKCLRTSGPATGLALRPPGVLVGSAAPATVTLRRFAAFPTVNLGHLAPGKFADLRIPADRAPEPWNLFTTAGPLTLCALAPQ